METEITIITEVKRLVNCVICLVNDYGWFWIRCCFNVSSFLNYLWGKEHLETYRFYGFNQVVELI